MAQPPPRQGQDHGFFFSPMGAQLPSAVAAVQRAAAPPQTHHHQQQQQQQRGGASKQQPAGTAAKLATHDMYWRWFQMADTDRDGRLVGADAVGFFERSALPRELLAKVWAAADAKRQGFLDFSAFCKALELMSLAQATGEVSLDSYANLAGAGIEPPRMSGLDTDPVVAAVPLLAGPLSARLGSVGGVGIARSVDFETGGGGGGGDGLGPAGSAQAEAPEAGPAGGIDLRRSAPAEVLGGGAVWGRARSDAGAAAAAAAAAAAEEDVSSDWRSMTMPMPGRVGGVDLRRSVEVPPLAAGEAAARAAAAGAATGVAAGAAAAGAAAAAPPRLDGYRGAEASPFLAIPSPGPSVAGDGGAGAFNPSPIGNASPFGAPSPFLAKDSSPSPAGLFGGRRKQARRAQLTAKDCTSISDGLKHIYFTKIRPLEEMYKFGHFFSPLLSEGDFEAKPSVLLLGQYSTGKSTFIRYLLGRDYPGIHIGPEPTTDRFVVVMHGPDERRTPGNTLVVQPDKPFTGLAQFGSGFLSKFEAAQCDNRLLEEITLVDTPGVLSGEKQRIERSYDFVQVCSWFAARCDLILLLFDPAKLDISDEFKNVIQTLRGHDEKVRVVLNKADSVDQQQLMRVYGALMWSLGKVFRSPEVCRVYIGSFNAGAPIRDDVNPAGRSLFEREQEDLLHDLYDIPARSCDRRVSEFVKRARAAKIHFLIMGHLRKQIPYFGQKKAQEKLLDNLGAEFAHVQREFHLHPGDFPDVERYREILSAFDLSRFPKLDKAMIRQVDDALSLDIPQLLRQFENPYT